MAADTPAMPEDTGRVEPPPSVSARMLEIAAEIRAAGAGHAIATYYGAMHDAITAYAQALAPAPAGGGAALVTETAWGTFDAEEGLLRTVPEAVMAEFEREARNHANLWTSGNEAARQSFQVAVSKAWVGGVQSAGCVLAATPQPQAVPEGSALPNIYIASKAVHGSRWRELREAGWPIISTWIDEAEQGKTEDWADLWDRCAAEPARAAVTILYREHGEELKGALVEVGAALSHGRKVFVVGLVPHTWLEHRNVTTMPNLDTALSAAKRECGMLAAPVAAAQGAGVDLAGVVGLASKLSKRADDLIVSHAAEVEDDVVNEREEPSSATVVARLYLDEYIAGLEHKVAALSQGAGAGVTDERHGLRRAIDLLGYIDIPINLAGDKGAWAAATCREIIRSEIERLDRADLRARIEAEDRARPADGASGREGE